MTLEFNPDQSDMHGGVHFSGGYHNAMPDTAHLKSPRKGNNILLNLVL